MGQTYVFEHQFSVRASVVDVAEFHYSPAAFRTLVPPGMLCQTHRLDPLADDSVNEFTMWMGPVPVYWKAVHSGVSDDGFTDTQTDGPMQQWVHQHRFEALSQVETLVVDRIEYEHESGLRGWKTRLLFCRPALNVLFAWRAWATRRACRQTR